MTVPVPTATTIRISRHAAEQYQRRVKPALEIDDAHAELNQLRAVGEITSVEPAWVNTATAAAYYLLVGDAALPLKAAAGGDWIATTCVARTTSAPARRSYKAAKASRKSAERRTRI